MLPPRLTRHVFVGLSAAVFGLCAVGGVAGANTSGVASGARVTVRANPDNAVVAAVRSAAGAVGLGTVQAVGFHPDCSPLSGQVVVCRNPNLSKNGARAVTHAGPNWCVVEADPRVGGAPHGVSVMTKALQHCLTS